MNMPADRASEIALARTLLVESRSAAFATLDSGGGPFASYVMVSPGPDNSPLLLLSRLAAHTRNARHDPRASLLFVREPPIDAASMSALRLTLTGRAVGVDNPDAKRLFLADHPEASRYAGFADFGIYRFEVQAGHLIAGFGRIVRLTPAELIGRDS
jgi:putative heme iron utilization protein